MTSKSTFRECRVEELQKDVCRAVQAYIATDKVVACYELTTIYSPPGLFSANETSTYAAILTESRLISASHSDKRFGNTAKYIPLADVISITQEQGLTFSVKDEKHYHVIAHGSGEVHVGVSFLSAQIANAFVELLNKHVNQAKNKHIPLSSLSPDDRLRRLSELYREGLVSEEEFHELRKQILKEL